MAAWEREGKYGKYTMWKKRDGKKWIYNVTTTGKVPKGDGGYYNKEALMRMKNIG